MGENYLEFLISADRPVLLASFRTKTRHTRSQTCFLKVVLVSAQLRSLFNRSKITKIHRHLKKKKEIHLCYFPFSIFLAVPLKTVYTCFQTKTAQNLTLRGCTRLYGSYRVGTPPPPASYLARDPQIIPF